MLSEKDRWRIVHYLQDGKSVSEVARLVLCTRPTVRHWRDHFQQYGDVDDSPRPGRPKKASLVVTRAISGKMRSKKHRSIRRLSRATAASSSTTLSPATVYRRVREAGGRARVRVKKPNLTPRQKRARVVWCREHRDKSTWWRRVLWSDEHSIPLYSDDRYEWVFGDDAPSPRRTSKFTPCFKVWAGFSWYGRTPLIRIPKGMDAEVYIMLLEEKMLPAADEMFDGHISKWWFQHDGDGTHTAKKTREWLDSDVPAWIKDWRSNSPDLNPIENAWEHLKQEMADVECGSLEEKWHAAQQAWLRIPQSYFRNLVESMPRRCLAVLAAKGGPTKY